MNAECRSLLVWYFPADASSDCGFLLHQAMHCSPLSPSQKDYILGPHFLVKPYSLIETLLLAIIQINVIQRGCFLSYTNQPVQVTCLLLSFRAPEFVSSSDIISSDFLQNTDKAI